MQLVRRAYAKVNLALAVGPPIPKGQPGAGMHPIASWMHCVDLFDTVHLTQLNAGSPSLETIWAADAPRQSPVDWPVEKDLCMRALRLLESHVGRTLPVGMRVEKRIPVGGGLGGGSSNAAAVLMGVNKLCSLGLTRETLFGLSAQIGSDVGFFIDEEPARPALVRGLADRIDRLGGLAGRAIVLIFPSFGCATGAVYRAFDVIGPGSLREREIEQRARAGDTESLFNDLDAPAAAVQPLLKPLREAVQKAAGMPVHMSGSGSTLFLLPRDGNGSDVAAKIEAEVTDISVRSTRLI